MVMRGLAVVGALALVVTGCTSHAPPRSVAISTEPATAVTAIKDSQGAVNTAARFQEPNLLLLQHYGSTTCPGVVSAISRLAARKVGVTIWQDYGSCTSDAKAFLSRVCLPQGVDSASPIEVRIKFRSGSETVTATR